MRKLALIALLATMSACSAGSGATYNAPGTASTPRAPQDTSFRAPSVDRIAGVNRIIGERASALLGRLGAARIDSTEGDTRKLQFAGASCVLDIYLYPLAAGQEPVATHIEARLREGGTAVEKSQCLAEVEAR